MRIEILKMIRSQNLPNYDAIDNGLLISDAG